MTLEDFEDLQVGDVLQRKASHKCFQVFQVRMPGLLVVFEVDAETREKLSSTLTTIRKPEGLTLLPRKGA